MTGGFTNEYTNCAFLFCEVRGGVRSGDGYLGDGGGALHLWQSNANCTNCSFINCFCNHYGGVVSQEVMVEIISLWLLLSISRNAFLDRTNAYLMVGQS
jgi:hypothetical protein